MDDPRLPDELARALIADLGADAPGAAVAEWLAAAHAAGRIDTPQLVEAVGALDVELPEGLGRPDPVVLASIGRGAMGEVFLARDERLARHVAVKRLTRGRPTPTDRAWFADEARILAQLDHPSIPPVHDLEVGPEGVEAYAMKLVRGRTLRQLLDDVREEHERRRRPAQDHALAGRLEVFVKICDAVHYAHIRGVVHRDLKPENVMIGAHGEVLVLDWGVALVLGRAPTRRTAVPLGQSAETMLGVATGTPAYMSPEQANGLESKLDARSDQYSLGLLLSELVTLERAVTGVSEVALRRARKGDRDVMRHAYREPVPRELRAIVDKATRADRRQRYPSVAALADEVQRFLRDEPILARPDGVLQRAKRWIGRHRGATLALLLSLALAASGVIVATGIGAAVVIEVARWRMARRQQALQDLVRGVAAHARRVDATFQGYEGLVTGLGLAAERALRLDPPDAPVVRPAELAATGSLADSAGYRAPISTASAIVWPSPGVGAEADREARQLASLQQELERVVLSSAPERRGSREEQRARLRSEGAPVVWAYVAHERGLLTVWPGSADYPADYEPRTQGWYLAGQGLARAAWDPASRDASDAEDVGLLVTALVGVWDGDHQVGVAGLDVAIDHVIDELLAPPDVAGPVDTWLVDADGRTMATSTARDVDPPPFPHREVLDADAGVEEVGGRLVAWAHLEALDWTYAVVGDPDVLLRGP